MTESCQENGERSQSVPAQEDAGRARGVDQRSGGYAPVTLLHKVCKRQFKRACQNPHEQTNATGRRADPSEPSESAFLRICQFNVLHRIAITAQSLCRSSAV